MTDSIERPAHYDFGRMEAREIIELAIADIPDPVTAYHVATTLKYFLRTSRKGGTEDIAKGCKHAGLALDAAKAHDIRKLRDIPPPHYDPDSVAFRHGDVDAVCGIARGARGIVADLAGEFTQPTNCSPGVSESQDVANRLHLPTSAATSGHPMAAEGLRLADEKPKASARRVGDHEWEVTWPWDVPVESAAFVADSPIPADEQPCNRPRRSESAWSVTWPDDAPRGSSVSTTKYQTLVGN